MSLYQGWPDFFDRGPNLKIIFHLRAALFKVSDDKVTISAFIVLWMLLLKFFDQISGCKKGPRAAKISWRAALWPPLPYIILNYCFLWY